MEVLNQRTLNVFVYGTLQPGGFYWPQFCAGKVSIAYPAWIKGRLYDFPKLGYPGLTLDNDRAEGWLLQFPEATASVILRELDRLEGFNETWPPERCEYQRAEGFVAPRLPRSDEANASDYVTIAQLPGPTSTWFYWMSLTKVQAWGGVPCGPSWQPS